jgi:hypothetical protein
VSFGRPIRSRRRAALTSLNSFNFSFIVPSSTAPYQRCIYGRTRHSSTSHTLLAELPLTHDSLFTLPPPPSLLSTVKATATFPGTFTSSIRSPPIAVYVVANPSTPGEVPLPTDLSIQHYSEDLGVRPLFSRATSAY